MRTAVVNVRQLVTPEKDRIRVIEDATLEFDGNLVTFVGTAGDATGDVDHTVDAEGGVVLPGFVDCHTHLVFAGSRANELEWRSQGKSYQEIAALGGGIKGTVARTRAATEEELFEEGLRHLTWCVRNGTTTLEAKSGYGLDLQTELHILLALDRINVAFGKVSDHAPVRRVFPTFLGLHALPTEYDGDKAGYVAHMVDEVLPVLAKAGLAVAVDAFIEQGYFDAVDARKLKEKATELDMKLRLHVDQLTDGGGAQLAAELGAQSADHLEHTSKEGIAALTGSSTVPVLLPGSVFGLGLSKYPDARAMLGAGLPVALATDFNPGSSPTPSIPFVMALAVRYLRMTPDECLQAVTVNAAKSLGLADRGRLGAGQLADFSIWPVQDWREVMGWIDGPRPSSVWVGGTQVAGA
ncbi:MAG: imidazolonepropionase [Armatimonadetes bacterium]|nr:imidazolonepropionase [Armatimonadota bacterium]